MIAARVCQQGCQPRKGSHSASPFASCCPQLRLPLPGPREPPSAPNSSPNFPPSPLRPHWLLRHAPEGWPRAVRSRRGTRAPRGRAGTCRRRRRQPWFTRYKMEKLHHCCLRSVSRGGRPVVGGLDPRGGADFHWIRRPNKGGPSSQNSRIFHLARTKCHSRSRRARRGRSLVRNYATSHVDDDMAWLLTKCRPSSYNTRLPGRRPRRQLLVGQGRGGEYTRKDKINE